jgi:hypothetical protein
MYDSTEKKLDDLYKSGNLEIAGAILKDYLAGNLEYSAAAQDLVTRIAAMAKEGRLNPQLCAPVLASVVVDPRNKDNPQTWRWAADAQYALRTLAETPEFAELGYDQSAIEGLANHFNEHFADREYSIGRFNFTSPKTKEIVTINPVQKAA